MKIVSFNCNSLCLASKGQNVFNDLKNLCSSFFTINTLIKQDEKEWDGIAYYSSYDENNSKGVAILFPKELEFDLCDRKMTSRAEY